MKDFFAQRFKIKVHLSYLNLSSSLDDSEITISQSEQNKRTPVPEINEEEPKKCGFWSKFFSLNG